MARGPTAMKNRFAPLLVASLVVALGCRHPPDPPPASASEADVALGEVARVHGGAGPWAVSGYRMGEYALRALGLERGSFDLEVVHFTPREVQYSCIADGAAAATGASLGKLNLTLAEAVAPETHTVYRRKSTGQAITLRVTKAFATRFTNVAPPRLKDAGREVVQLPDADIFEVVP
jgi:formylmethanofuran dehydrogenase subunit E